MDPRNQSQITLILQSYIITLFDHRFPIELFEKLIGSLSFEQGVPLDLANDLRKWGYRTFRLCDVTKNVTTYSLLRNEYHKVIKIDKGWKKFAYDYGQAKGDEIVIEIGQKKGTWLM